MSCAASLSPSINPHDILQKREVANKDESAAKKQKVVILEVKSKLGLSGIMTAGSSVDTEPFTRLWSHSQRHSVKVLKRYKYQLYYFSLLYTL